MRVVVLGCEKDRLARFACPLLLTEAETSSRALCLGWACLSCLEIDGSRVCRRQSCSCRKCSPSRSLVERRCPSLSISRTDPRAAAKKKALRALFGSIDLFFTSWLLALLLVLVASRQHCTTRRVPMLPHVCSIGEAGKGKLECD